MDAEEQRTLGPTVRPADSAGCLSAMSLTRVVLAFMPLGGHYPLPQLSCLLTGSIYIGLYSVMSAALTVTVSL